MINKYTLLALIYIILAVIAFYIPYIPMIAIGVLTALWSKKNSKDFFIGLIYIMISSFVAFGVTPWVNGSNQVYVMGGDSLSFPRGLGISVFIGFLISGFFCITTLAVIHIKKIIVKRFTS